VSAFCVVDLFAGPGGLSEGFESNGSFEIGISIECDPYARRTLLLRSFLRQFAPSDIPEAYYDYVRGEISSDDLYNRYQFEFETADRIATLARLGETQATKIDSMIRSALGTSNQSSNFVLIGGPPCQAYSLVGRSRRSREDRVEFEKDERHYLYKEYLRILKEHKPAVFVMENVKGILSAKLRGNKIFSKICDDLSGAGYTLFGLAGKPSKSGDLFDGGEWDPAAFLIRSEDHGIPQKRHRVFILGVKNELVDSKWSHETFALPKSVAPSVGEAIGGLPKVWSALSSPDEHRRDWLKARERGLRAAGAEWAVGDHAPKNDRGGIFVQGGGKRVFDPKWYLDDRIGGVLNHQTRTHIAEDITRYAFVAEFARQNGFSPSILEFPKRLLPEHKNVQDLDENVPFADRFRVQLRDEASTTVTSHISKDGHYYIHYDPEQARSLTVREAARLQTFPDNYFFEGPRTQQYHQVGNAVPPLLARQIAQLIREKILN
jgi:DNA (cytosine-5)-methyltransferase 1